MAIVGQFEMREEMRKKSTAYKVSIPIGSVMDVREETKVDQWMSNSNYNQVIEKHRQNVILLSKKYVFKINFDIKIQISVFKF